MAADRVLTWYIPGFLSETGVVGSNVSTEYTLDQNYVPGRLHIRLKEKPSPDGEPCTIDINDDGESIFPQTQKPILTTDEVTYISFAGGTLAKDSVITLDIDQVSPKVTGKDLTVELELNKA